LNKLPDFINFVMSLMPLEDAVPGYFNSLPQMLPIWRPLRC